MKCLICNSLKMELYGVWSNAYAIYRDGSETSKAFLARVISELVNPRFITSSLPEEQDMHVSRDILLEDRESKYASLGLMKPR